MEQWFSTRGLWPGLEGAVLRCARESPIGLWWVGARAEPASKVQDSPHSKERSAQMSVAPWLRTWLEGLQKKPVWLGGW